ncbi:unnamed protein product [Leptosia nina]|uniref:Uncharacterized protein n=1 Tax=Leptosia nina TaxID=320188 RepID=A0AAV1J4U9_9NEOP
MGNSKSRKMKISQADTNTEESRERINTIKTESPDVSVQKNGVEVASEQTEEKNNDNASSASTVEVLDDK